MMQETQNFIHGEGHPPDVSITREIASRERWDYARRFGFVVITESTLSAVPVDRPMVSVGAGTGALERALVTHRGADIRATDCGANHYGFIDKHYPIARLKAQNAVRKYPDRAVLMSWPSYDQSWPYETARAMAPGQLLYYIGESIGGCTADDAFHEYLKSDFTPGDSVGITQWNGLHDHLEIWRKK